MTDVKLVDRKVEEVSVLNLIGDGQWRLTVVHSNWRGC